MHSQSTEVCVSALLFLENAVSLELLSTSDFYSLSNSAQHKSLISEQRGLIKASNLGLSAPSLSLSAQCPMVNLCSNSYLLQLKASLMKDKQCTDI